VLAVSETLGEKAGAGCALLCVPVSQGPRKPALQSLLLTSEGQESTPQSLVYS